MSGNGNASIGDVHIAFKNDVGVDIRMQRARYQVAFACDTAAVIAHRFGCGDDAAAVVGRIAKPNKVNHANGHPRLYLAATLSLPNEEKG